MKRLTSILLAVMLVCSLLLATPISVSAAAQDAQDGLEVAIVTDKDSYAAGEEIKLSVSIKNTNPYEITGINVKTLLPEGLTIKAGELDSENLTIPAGETYAAEVVVTVKASAPAPTEPKPTEPKPTEPKPTTPTETKTPETGDSFSVLLCMVLVVASAVGMFMLMKNKKAMRTMCLILCAAMVLSMVPASAFAAEDTATITVDKAIKVGGKDYTLSVKVTYPQTGATEGICTVTFDSNGGSAVASQRVTNGQLLEYPEDPELDGHLFVGWYTDSDFAEMFDFTEPVTKSCTLVARWVDVEDTTDTDGDGLTDAIEEYYGTDKAVADTDADGLSDYIEVSVLSLNPLKQDTDENGVLDGDEDTDADTIKNSAEVALGTNPTDKDTDADGIDDCDEVNTYNTDPCNSDTDGDGLNDGDELALGLNPLVQKTDGVTLDSERIFTQELSEENVSEVLLSEENDAVPSLTVTASGNINSSVAISTTSLDFGDSRAVTGEPIDVSGEGLDEGTISFFLRNSATAFSVRDTGDTFNTNLICKYNDDGTTDYLDTSFDSASSTITADISGEGTYFVLDVKSLFDELGLALPTVAELDALTDPEPIVAEPLESAAPADEENANGNGTAAVSMPKLAANAEAASATTEKTITRASSGVMAQADIVFLIDTTGSMGDEIDHVKENVQYFVDALKQKGVSAALALIDYEDITVDGYDSTRVHKNGTSNWFYDIEAYKTAIANLGLGYGGDGPECAVDALETGRLLDMRASAGKIFVLVTDADYKVDNRYGIPSMAAEIELLQNAGVTCAVVSSSYDQSVYYDLYTKTGGVWADIYGDFYTELMKLADEIGDDIVGDGYWIYLQGPVPVPVRLDAKPTPGSDVDTDKDGIPDIEELEGATPSGMIDLDALIAKVSRGAITGTDYGTVMMYKYKSSPTETDTDGDQVYDNVDKTPKVFTITDRVLSMVEGLSYSNLADYVGLTLGAAIEKGAVIKKGNITDEGIQTLKNAIIVHSNNSGGIFFEDFFTDRGLGSLALKFVRPGDTTAVVYALRGTEPKDDTVNDIMTDLVLGLGADSAQSQVAFEEYKTIACNSSYDYYVTGHSLGGRLALDVMYKIHSANRDGLFKRGENIPEPVHAVTFNGLGYNQAVYYSLMLLGMDVFKEYENDLTNFYYWQDLFGEGTGSSILFTRPGQDVRLLCKDIEGNKYREDELDDIIVVRDIKYHGIKFFQEDYDLLPNSPHDFPYWVD